MITTPDGKLTRAWSHSPVIELYFPYITMPPNLRLHLRYVERKGLVGMDKNSIARCVYWAPLEQPGAFARLGIQSADLIPASLKRFSHTQQKGYKQASCGISEAEA
jgi:hypothetical protein